MNIYPTLLLHSKDPTKNTFQKIQRHSIQLKETSHFIPTLNTKRTKTVTQEKKLEQKTKNKIILYIYKKKVVFTKE